ncbi:NAD(P)-binding protein [Sorangium sp. So ce1128]
MRKKIVILGGGIAALTAAFELSSAPDWKERYAITVYQVGHRLGGKGASGRNQKKHDRIEEHGLHLYYGFYDNAFHVMRRCYEELGRPAGAPLATLEEAFKPHSLVVFEEQHQGAWQHQPLLFPRNAEAPGSREPVPPPAELIPRMLRFLNEMYEQQLTLKKEGAEAWRAGDLTEDAWNALTKRPPRGLSVFRVAARAASKLADEVSSYLLRDKTKNGPAALGGDDLLGASRHGQPA